MRVVIGVDESGTGAWAGPYSVCAAAVYAHESDLLRRVGGRDSKKMTDIRRRAAIVAISDVLLYACNVLVPVTAIDARKKDAWRDAIIESVGHVVELLRQHGIATSRIEIVIDGLPDPRTQKRISRELGIAAIKFLTSAEDQVPAVGAASVIAKTERNDAMRELHEKYPVYGWNKNYGYGTQQHADAIERHGRSPQHRDLKVDVLVRKKE
jgi:ribonuclease HII